MKQRNRLASAKSPYLLQHAENPVPWHPWDEQALARARVEDKPIFLSVGYATCHWCHVMERESFEDEETAALLEEYFICIKVDREERPDIDRVYMGYVQAVSGSGGWPMSVWLTPELKPFFGGTYFPPEDRYGRPGFRTVSREIGEAWRNERERVLETANGAIAVLQQLVAPQHAGDLAGAPLFEAAFERFRSAFDSKYGGFGDAPKFPRPVTLLFLLRYHERTDQPFALEMVRETLEQMGRGGIYDHLGDGFHRYSVDQQWHVPHFEKMLYDQAQLLRSYVELYQLSGEPGHAAVARGIARYVLRDLRDDAHHGFFSAEDADSLPAADAREKREGAFYVWTDEELRERLGDGSELFCQHFGVAPDGNADDPHGELEGTNILHARGPLELSASALGISSDDAATQLARARELLLEARANRARPQLDDKVLCSWNGMMISALARAAGPLAEPSYLDAARSAAHFARAHLEQDGVLHRRYRDGEVAIRAFVEDYAQLIEGLIDLYQAGFEPRWLRWAEELQSRQLELFWDNDAGGFFADDGEDSSVLMRLKDDYDGAEPAANSTSALNLLRLAALLGHEEWEERARETIAAFSKRLEKYPEVMPQMLTAYDLLLRGPIQLIIVGEAGAPSTRALADAARSTFSPRLSLLSADEEMRDWLGETLPQLGALPRPGELPTARAYLCRDRRCEAPMTDPDEVRRHLNKRGPEGPQRE